jgi:gas vesicle protein
MSSTLNDTMHTAKDVMDAAKCGAEHALHSAQKDARSSLLGTITAVGGLVAILRSLDVDDGLGWIGLTRKRTAFRTSAISTVAFFGAGIALGTGAALLFAPASGADTRRKLRARFEGVKRDAEDTLERVGTEVKQLEQKAESFVTRAKDAAKKAEHEIENKVSEGIHTAKDVAKSQADAALGTVQNAAEDARSALRSTETSTLPTGSGSSYPRTPGGPGTGPRFS